MNPPTPPSSQSYHDIIAAVAHELWDKGGRQPNRDLDHWLEAERYVLAQQRYGNLPGTTGSAKAAPPDVTKPAAKPVSAAAEVPKHLLRGRAAQASRQQRPAA